MPGKDIEQKIKKLKEQKEHNKQSIEHIKNLIEREKQYIISLDPSLTKIIDHEIDLEEYIRNFIKSYKKLKKVSWLKSIFIYKARKILQKKHGRKDVMYDLVFLMDELFDKEDYSGILDKSKYSSYIEKIMKNHGFSKKEAQQLIKAMPIFSKFYYIYLIIDHKIHLYKLTKGLLHDHKEKKDTIYKNINESKKYIKELEEKIQKLENKISRIDEEILLEFYKKAKIDKKALFKLYKKEGISIKKAIKDLLSFLNIKTDENDDDEKEKIGFDQNKKKSSKKSTSSDATSQTPKNSKDNFAGDNVKPNKTTDTDEEYIFIIDPIEKKVVRKKIKKQAKPLTHKEIEKYLKELQKFTVVLPESDYFMNSEKPNQIKKLPEFYVVKGTNNHKTLIEGQKYWMNKLITFYSKPFKKGPVEKPKPIDAEMSKIDVTTLVVFTAAIAAILKKLNKFKGKIKTVQNKITQTKSGNLSRMKLKPSNNKKLSRTKNVSQAKAKGKVTKGGLKLNGKNIGQSNSSGTPKVNPAGKGNGQGGSNKVGTRISGRPAVGRCSSWARMKTTNERSAYSGKFIFGSGTNSPLDK